MKSLSLSAIGTAKLWTRRFCVLGLWLSLAVTSLLAQSVGRGGAPSPVTGAKPSASPRPTAPAPAPASLPASSGGAATSSGASSLSMGSTGVLGKISPNDVIEVRVYQEPDLDCRPRVSADGKVALPLVGEVEVAGKDASEAKNIIAARYKQGYLVNPQVSVTIIEQTKRKFTILGQVTRPGAYFFPDNESLTLLQAIGIAGGYTRLANPKKIIVKRVEGGRERIIEVNGKEQQEEGKSFKLMPNDIIDVDESTF